MFFVLFCCYCSSGFLVWKIEDGIVSWGFVIEFVC